MINVYVDFCIELSYIFSDVSSCLLRDVLALLLLMEMLFQGTKAFCSGGDQTLRTADGYADSENSGRLNVLDLQVDNLQYCMLVDLKLLTP